MLIRNIAYHCTSQKVLSGFGSKVALRLISPDFSNQDETYLSLDTQSNQYVNFITNAGFKKKDVFFTFLPKSIEQFIAFLGSLKAGIIIGTLFSTFGEEALADRLSDSKAKCLITKRSLYKKIQRIENNLPDLERIVLIDIDEDMSEKVISWKQHVLKASQEFKILNTSYDTPSVLHYTSGSTGKPKGVLHHHGSLSTQIQTANEVLQLKPDFVYWCTADQGWVTGTTYGIIAPLAIGVTSVHYTGGYDARIWFEILQREKVDVWYTAPTALRMLMKEPDEFFQRFDLSSLKYIFSVGEPLNTEIYHWGKRVLNKEIYDTWFQTETGCIMIGNRPSLPVKPGSMGKPVDNIIANIIDDQGNVCQVNQRGHLCIKPPWDSMFIDYLYHTDQYRDKFKNGWYYSGDTAYRDEEDYYWFTGRSDDIINTSGHLLSPFEVESALLEIPEIAESGVIGSPDKVLFEKVVAFISLKNGYEYSPDLELKIRIHISNRLASYAIPQDILILNSIPKNKSGKIMRRFLKAQYLGLDPGDISTLEE